MAVRGSEKGMVLVLAGAAALTLALAGRKADCGKSVKLGDFEFSQGNYANAVKRYEQALRDDPNCYNVEGKLVEARRKAASER